MKKLSDITESIWSDIQKRSAGETIREEDKFNPEYVDFGDDTTVYWAVDNLEIDGNVKFNFDDVKDLNKNGWRLPTVDEVNQLKWNIRTPWYEGCKHLKFDDGNELRLKTIESGGFHMWTNEINPKFPNCAFSYGFDNMGSFNIDSFNISSNRLFVFLVKDKNYVNESIWSDIQKRSTGETIRKEDDVINMDFKTFWLHLIAKYKDKVYKLDKGLLDREYEWIEVEPIKDIHIMNNYVEDELGRIMVILTDRGIDRRNNTIKKILSSSPDNIRWIRTYSDRFEIKLHNGEITNQTVIDLIEFFLSTQIFESIWSDIQKRSSGEIIRKEDEIVSNIKKLKPIDMGVSVLWADDDLIVEDNCYFTFDEANELVKNTGWRLPTLAEVAEFEKKENIYLETYNDKFVINNHYNELVFYKKGFIYVVAGLSDKVTDDDYYYAWTGDTHNDTVAHIFSFDNDHIIHSSLNSNSVMNQVVQGKNDKLCVRLVKDK